MKNIEFVHCFIEYSLLAQYHRSFFTSTVHPFLGFDNCVWCEKTQSSKHSIEHLIGVVKVDILKISQNRPTSSTLKIMFRARYPNINPIFERFRSIAFQRIYFFRKWKSLKVSTPCAKLVKFRKIRENSSISQISILQNSARFQIVWKNRDFCVRNSEKSKKS